MNHRVVVPLHDGRHVGYFRRCEAGVSHATDTNLSLTRTRYSHIRPLIVVDKLTYYLPQ